MPAVIIIQFQSTFTSPDFTLRPIFCSNSNDDGCSSSRIMIKAVRMSLKVEPVTFYLQASCDGLLYLQSSPSCNYICDPLTKEWIELPDFTFRCETICAFFHQPAMNEYRLLRHFSDDEDFGYEILTVGAKEWREIECTFDGTPSPSLLSYVRKGPLPCCLEPPVSMHGKLHWFSVDSPTAADCLIMVLDINLEKFGQLSVPKICQEQHTCCQTHLFELEGKLAVSVVASATEMDLWILEDYDKEVWFKKYRIDIQGIQGTPKIITNKFFRPLVVSQAGEAVVSFLGDLVLYDLKHHTWFKIDGVNDMLDDFFFLYKESLVRHDFLSWVHGMLI